MSNQIMSEAVRVALLDKQLRPQNEAVHETLN